MSVFISDNINWSLHINKKIVSEYDHEIPQSQMQTNPWHREESAIWLILLMTLLEVFLIYIHRLSRIFGLF